MLLIRDVVLLKTMPAAICSMTFFEANLTSRLTIASIGAPVEEASSSTATIIALALFEVATSIAAATSIVATATTTTTATIVVAAATIAASTAVGSVGRGARRVTNA
jgi:hypothetical protein